MQINLLRHGFFLIFLALCTGFVTPMVALPRLAVSAHTIGVVSGILLIILASLWPAFRLTINQLRVLKFSWLFAAYANWGACVAGAFLGTGRMTPVASADAHGPVLAETLVSAILMSVALFSLLAVGLSLWGLRGNNKRNGPEPKLFHIP